MKGKRKGVFGQLIILLSAALIALLIFLTVMLMQVRAQQVEADQDYFERQVQAIEKSLQDKLAEIKMVGAEISVSDTLQKYLATEDTLQRWQYSKALMDIQKIFLSQNNLVSFVDMYRPDGERYILFYTDYALSTAVQEELDLADLSNRGSSFLLLSPDKSRNYSNYAYVSPVFAQTSGTRLGTIALFGHCSHLIRNDEYVSVCLRDARGRTYPHPIPEEYDAQRELPFGLTAYFVHTKAYVDTAISRYIKTLFIVLAMMLGTLLLTGILLVRQLTHPVRQISKQMEAVKHNQRKALSISHGGVELIQLCDEINTMLETIEERNRESMEAHDKLYQAELARVQASLYALRNQINPHFLYNTLQTVRGMALYHHAPEIARITTNMAYIFRYSIREEPLAEAEEEMAAARKYMEIMNARQDNRFQYEETMPPDIAHCRVPRMIVQPVIENAVKYAFENLGVAPRISVRWERDGEDILVAVKDNGSGMTQDALAELKEKMEQPFSPEDAREAGGIGLHNIHQRLRLRYGEAYGVSIAQEKGRGMCVVLRMPFEKEDRAQAH